MANRLPVADAERVRRVAQAVVGRGIEVVRDEEGITLTGPAAVLQPLIDAGDLRRFYQDFEQFED